MPQSGALTAHIELAASEGGPALLTGPAGVRPGSSPDSRIVMGTITIAPLPPGDLLVRAVISLDGQPVGRAWRTFRKVGR